MFWHKSLKQECATRECLTRVSQNYETCQTKVPLKSVTKFVLRVVGGIRFVFFSFFKHAGHGPMDGE